MMVLGLVSTSHFPISRTQWADIVQDHASLFMLDPQIERGEFSLYLSWCCAVFPAETRSSNRESLKWVPYGHYVLCIPYRDEQQEFLLMNTYLFQDLFFPFCTTVNSTWTKSRTGCLRQTQERPQYPIVHYKEIHRELQRSIFPQYDSSTIFVRVRFWCQAATVPFITLRSPDALLMQDTELLCHSEVFCLSIILLLSVSESSWVWSSYLNLSPLGKF